MKKYAVNGLSVSGTGPQTAGAIMSVAGTRGLVSEITFGVRTAPNATDQQVRFTVGAVTAAPSGGTSPAPKPLDTVDPVAASCTTFVAPSGEPTYAAQPHIDSDMNQRGLYRWVAEIGFELGTGTGTANGISGKMTASTSALVMSQVFHYKE